MQIILALHRVETPRLRWSGALLPSRVRNLIMPFNYARSNCKRDSIKVTILRGDFIILFIYGPHTMNTLYIIIVRYLMINDC